MHFRLPRELEPGFRIDKGILHLIYCVPKLHIHHAATHEGWTSVANQMANTETNSVIKPNEPIDAFVLQGGSVISSVFEIFVLSMVRISDM